MDDYLFRNSVPYLQWALFSIFTQSTPHCGVTTVTQDCYYSVNGFTAHTTDPTNKCNNYDITEERTQEPRRPWFTSANCLVAESLPEKYPCILAWEDETEPTRHIIDFSSSRLRYLLIWGLSEVIRAIVRSRWFPSIEARPGPLFAAAWLTPTACVLGRTEI